MKADPKTLNSTENAIFRRLSILVFIVFTTSCTSPDSSRSGNSDEGNIFTGFIQNQNAPAIIDTLKTELTGNVEVTALRFESVVDTNRANTIFAYQMVPQSANNCPAILILHGGAQNADNYFDLGLEFANRGYVCLIPDIPGIADPKKASREGKGSIGKWMDYPYVTNHFRVNPNATASSIYEGVVACIQSFYLLKNHPKVDENRIGIRGLSWGGYATTIVSGLLREQVSAAYAVYGCGYFDLPSWFKPYIEKLPPAGQEEWLMNLDAGRYARDIKAPFYFMAASNDTYFWPPAVMATFDEIRSEKFILFAPNNDHNLSNVLAPDSTEFTFFEHYLKEQGEGIGKVKILNNMQDFKRNQQVRFRIESKAPIMRVKLWYSSPEAGWKERKWKFKEPVETGSFQYKCEIPPLDSSDGMDWYIVVTDSQKVSFGTKIHEWNQFKQNGNGNQK